MIRKKDIDIINRASQIADKYKLTGLYTMVACLYQNKKILSYGVNDYEKTHPNTSQIYEDYIIPTHAEVDCISKWIVKNRKITEDMTVCVVGYTKACENNFVISSFPCQSCMDFIKKTGIKRIVYMVNEESKVSIKEFLL
jgi:tRNA(Arg) A34 adenosine deaminase TadA